jgi:hypothetical protein
VRVLKAQVRGGRLVLDEPTDLPEGTEVELTLVGDEFDPGEHARLHQAIEDGAQDIERATTTTASSSSAGFERAVNQRIGRRAQLRPARDARLTARGS